MTDAAQSIANNLTAFAPGQNSTIGSQQFRNLSLSAHNIVPSLVSAAGTNLATATVLTAHSNIVTVCASGAGVVARSDFSVVYNRASNAVLVYPYASGAQFESYGNGNPVSIPVGGKAEIYMTSPTQGY